MESAFDEEEKKVEDWSRVKIKAKKTRGRKEDSGGFTRMSGRSGWCGATYQIIEGASFI